MTRTKPVRRVFDQWEDFSEPIPMLVCAWCGNGPIMPSDGDDCCTLTERPNFLRLEGGTIDFVRLQLANDGTPAKIVEEFHGPIEEFDEWRT